MYACNYLAAAPDRAQPPMSLCFSHVGLTNLGSLSLDGSITQIWYSEFLAFSSKQAR